MSGARKLQTEIDRTLKKVEEGVEIFDDLHAKVYAAEAQNQKEKYESDLKKEIKKLQRLRDQIKTWIGAAEVKEKDPLIDARKTIETKMELFKVCEKDTKTKTYSKEGLARGDRLSPEEMKKEATCEWVTSLIEALHQAVEQNDAEVERLGSGKGKKNNKKAIETLNQHIANHKAHIAKLETVNRLVANDSLEPEVVDEVKEDLDFYLEAYLEDPEFLDSYDEDYYYDSLGLDGLDAAPAPVAAPALSTKEEKKLAKAKSSASSGTISLTIGRAKASKATVDPVVAASSNKTPTKSAPVPTPVAPSPALVKSPSAGTSMAAMLKGGEEKAKQAQAAAQAQAAQVQAAAKAAQDKAVAEQKAAADRAEADRVRQEADRVRQMEALAAQQKADREKAAAQAQANAAARAQQEQQEQQAAAQAAQLAQQQQQAQQIQQQQQQVMQQQQAVQQQQQAAQQQAAQQQAQMQMQQKSPEQLLNNLSISGSPSVPGQQQVPPQVVQQQQQFRGGAPAVQQPPQQSPSTGAALTQTLSLDAAASYLSSLTTSFSHIPSANDSDRPRSYAPRNPYPTPASYPAQPSTIFENPAIFEKLGTDCLFFIFYYQQGTYQQYLAARELKKQSWRYHKKYMTWFQRHEEPKITTDEYEQGTYVYFDYESGWCQRVKADFRFEYAYLEDSGLKPDNMLLTKDWQLKLTDFGEARAVNLNQTMTSVGTPIYVAPEVMSGYSYDSTADSYSFGICLVP